VVMVLGVVAEPVEVVEHREPVEMVVVVEMV
jgi:hypothetical protein